jgi:glyoxylase-like metal-dependent hydrolase (beta-lactamase superfamily II)
MGESATKKLMATRAGRRVMGALLATVLVGALGYSSWAFLGHRGVDRIERPTEAVRFRSPPVGLRLHVFETGKMVLDAWTVAPGARGKRVMDQPAYVIEHPTAGLFMFEAGHHPDVANDAREHLGWIHAVGLMPMQQERGQDAVSQMRQAGLRATDVRAVIVSHFHPEHVGAVEELPHATVVADEREIDHGLHDADYNYVRSEYDQVAKWRRLAFGGTPTFGPFPGSVDLLGDGSVIVVSSPGHTPGHISVAVNLPSGPVLLAGDVAWTDLNLETTSIGLPFVSSDGEAARHSLAQLLRFRDDNPHVLIVPGHDLGPLRRALRPDVVLHPWPRLNAAK